MISRNFWDKKIVIYGLAIFMATIWGLSFLGTKVALRELSVIESVTMRWTAATVVCLVLMATKVIKVSYKGKPLKYVIIAGLMQPGIYGICETAGIAETTTTESAILVAMVPIVVAILTIFFLKEAVARRGIAGIVIAFLGIVINSAFSEDFSLSGKWFGYLMLIVAVTAGAIFTLLSKKISDEGYFSSLEITATMCFTGAIIYNIVSLVNGNGINPYVKTLTNLDTALAVLFLGLGCSVVCYIIFNFVVQKLPAHQASALQVNLITIMAVLSGIVIEGDDYGIHTLVGVAMMLCGIMMLNNENKKTETIPEIERLEEQI